MSERQTGATDAQIDAAAARLWASEHDADEPWDAASEWSKDVYRASIELDADLIVPPGQVITAESRVPTDDELVAMGNVASWTAHFAKDGTLGPELKRSAELVRAYLERQR